MKTVVITGGAKRLGKALVESFAKDGWQVLFTSRYSFEDGVSLANELGQNVHCIGSAVSSRGDAGMIRTWVESVTDGVDLLICSASSYKRLTVEQTMPSDFDDLLQSNLLGPYFLAQQLHGLLKSNKGNIINIGDSQVESGLPEFSAYLAAKAALVSITKSIALEWAPDVRVNAVMPGTMPWPNKTFSVQEQSEMTNRIPLQRVGDWTDIVQAVRFLNEAKYVTGTCFHVDGGRSAIY